MIRAARYLMRRSPRGIDQPAPPTRIRSDWIWLAVSLFALPLLYILSFGPACWWFGTSTTPLPATGIRVPMKRISTVYWPIGYVARRSAEKSGTGIVFRGIVWYATLGAPSVSLPADNSGQHWITVFRR